jgi:nicotinate phosphoribosyltransferase
VDAVAVEQRDRLGRPANARRARRSVGVAPSFSSSFSFGFSELLFASRLVEAGRTEPWTFEVVALPRGEQRPFLIAAGLEQALSLLEGLELAETDLALLRAEPGPGKIDVSLDEEALDRICALRFSGDVQAVPEGTVVFAGEPVLRLRAPAPEAVVVGAAVVSALRVQIAVATKAARFKLAAGGRPLYEIGPSAFARDGSLLAARAAYLGGTTATANPLAAGVWGIPALPVVPLSLVQAMGESAGPLSTCALRLDGDAATRIEGFVATPTKPRALLVDVTGTQGATRVMALRARMNAQGWRDVQLVAAGELDEATLEELSKPNVPLDGFAIGTSLLVGAELDALSFEYELVERENAGQRIAFARRDGGAGRRAVWRRRESGRYKGDIVQSETKPPPSGAMPLLVPVMEKGKRQFRTPNLAEPRVLCEAQLSMLDAAVTRRLEPANYPVTFVVEKPVAPPAAAAPAPTPRPAAPARAAPPSRASMLEQLDDSADFTVVSNVFAAVVASKLAPDAVEPLSETPAETSGEAQAETSSDSSPAAASSESSDPPEIELEEIVDEPSASAFGELVPSHSPRANEARAEAVAAPAAAKTPPVVAAASPLAPPPPFAATPSTPAAAAPFVAPPPPPPAAEAPANPLLAAAARLRSMQGGGSPPPAPKLEMAMPAAMPLAPSAPAPAAPAAPAAASNGAAKDPGDPLLAAAARLKSMRRS